MHCTQIPLQPLQTAPLCRVDAILMASGASERFGAQNKLLQPFAGLPLALHTLLLATGSRLFQRVFFVYAQPEVGHLAQNLCVTPLQNHNPARGACESIRLGVNASSAEYFLFMQCDQPLLDKNTLESLLANKQPGHIVVPTYQGRHASPVLYCSTFKRQLATLPDGKPARSIIADYPDKVIPVEVRDPLVLADVDTPADLSALESFIKDIP